MPNDKFSLPLDIYYEHLKTINGVEFTPREIDIISCILNQRANSISSFLSIGPRAVETHSRNIRQKAGGLSGRENIIDFIEKSGKLSLIRNEYYVSLRIRVFFEELLDKISKGRGAEAPVCLLVYEQEGKYPSSLIPSLKDHLRRVGFKIKRDIKEGYQFFSQSANELSSKTANHILYIVPETFDLPVLIQCVPQDLSVVFLLQSKIINAEESEMLKKFNVINISKDENYYISFFEILKKLLPNCKIDDPIEDFKRDVKGIYSSPMKDELKAHYEIGTSVEASSMRIRNEFIDLLFNVLKKKKLIISGGIIILSVVFLYLLILPVQNKNKILTLSKETQKTTSIQSNLNIPSESTFLARPELITEIENKFKEGTGIKTVALVGIGGAGKTTIARQFARQQKASVAWEINAETKRSLKDSFENLAQALAKTDEDKKTLREIQEIKNPPEREEKILKFVMNQLKIHTNWFLMYDNVENILDIQDYFPADLDKWGRGELILTSRNHNIQNYKHVNHFIKIEELTQDQKLKLFIKILEYGNKISFTASQKEKTKKFLEKIPPYPLDVSVAAYYIKATNSSYEGYLTSLTQYNEDFENIQETLLNESGDYTKTRYNLITISLQKLIEIHKDFKDLLLFISLLDSQNIPREVLDNYKNNVTVDNFIYNLRKYSLLTNESSPFNLSLSMHRSTQAISLGFLIKKLHLKQNHPLLDSIPRSLGNYVADIIDKEDSFKMKLFISHFETLLRHNNLLTNGIKGNLGGELGCIHFYLGNYVKSKQILEKSLSDLDVYDSKNYRRIAQVLMHLGCIYREIGTYEEDKIPIDLYEQSIGIYKKYLSKDHIGVAHALGYLGMVFRNHGQYKKAQSTLEQSLMTYKKHSENYTGAARAMTYLGIVHRNLGSFQEAKSILHESLTTYKRFFPQDYIGIAHALVNLGNVYRELGNYEKAESLLTQGIQIYKSYFSENHLGMFAFLSYLGILYKDQGDYAKAKTLFEQSLFIHRKHVPEDSAWVLTHLGNVYMRLGDYKKAKDSLEKTLVVYKKRFPGKSTWVSWVLMHLGNIYKSLGEYEKAKDLFEQSAVINKELLGDGNIRTSWVLAQLGNIYRELGHYSQAKMILETSLELHRNHFVEEHVKIRQILLFLGYLYKELGDYKKAKNILEKNLSICEKGHGREHIETARILRALGQVYFLEGQIELAKSLIKKSLQIFQKYNHPDAYIVLEDMAEIHLNKSTQFMNVKDIQQSKIFKIQAIRYLNQALKIVKTNFPTDSPHIKRIEIKLKKLEEG